MNHSVAVAVTVKSFHQSNRLTSCLRSKFYDQCSSDDLLPQGHLIVLSVPCYMCKDYFKETFFEMNKFLKKEPIHFCKFYDNEGTISCCCGRIISSIRPFEFRSKFYCQNSSDDIVLRGISNERSV